MTAQPGSTAVHSVHQRDTALDCSQATVDDQGWRSAMVPHHSLAITRSARADLDDVRVCQLAAAIIAEQEARDPWDAVAPP